MSAESTGRHDLSEVAARVIAHAEDISEIKASIRAIQEGLKTLNDAEQRREGARRAVTWLGTVGLGVVVAMAGALGWFAAHYRP